MGIMGRELAGRLASWMEGFSSLSWLICALGVSAGAILAGVLLSKLVEWPVLRLRDRVFPSRSGALPSAPAVSQPETQSAEQVPISVARSALKQGNFGS